MIKSILFGNEIKIGNVYSKYVIDELKLVTGLHDKVINKTMLIENNSNFRDVEYIFSTWGIPAMNIDEIQKYFPSLRAVFYAAGSVKGFAQPFLNCGVKIFSAWVANAVPVAEYTLAQILLANKNFYSCSRFASVGDMATSRKIAGEIVGNYYSKIGIIGVGAIGSRVIEYLKHHDVEIFVYDPFLPDKQANKIGVKKANLEEIFSQCQTISNHLANNPQTVGKFNYDLFRLMCPNAVFINTGRGAQVVEEDLCRVLKERIDLTAVLDVTFPEPPGPGHDFYFLPNVILTPHISGSMGREVERMSLYMLDEFKRYIAGEKLLYEINKEMLITMA